MVVIRDGFEKAFPLQLETGDLAVQIGLLVSQLAVQSFVLEFLLNNETKLPSEVFI
jgi:hypothetical protein